MEHQTNVKAVVVEEVTMAVAVVDHTQAQVVVVVEVVRLTQSEKLQT